MAILKKKMYMNDHWEDDDGDRADVSSLLYVLHCFAPASQMFCA